MREKWVTALGASVVALAMSTGAFGQSAGSPGDQSPRPVSDPGGTFRGSQTDYPAPEVQTVPVAMARAATARAEQLQSLNDLHATVDRLREDFKYSAEMISAVREENTAYYAYDDARRKVLDRLSNDPTYRAMLSLVLTLKHKLDDQRPGAKPTEEELERLLATATLKLSYASAASAMESAALAADEQVTQTRARLVDAGAKTAALRSDFERKIRRDPEFLAARRSLDEARISRLTAEAFLDGAVDARELALNYAYYLHRFDQYSYSPASINYSPYPYGYGYRRY